MKALQGRRMKVQQERCMKVWKLPVGCSWHQKEQSNLDLEIGILILLNISKFMFTFLSKVVSFMSEATDFETSQNDLDGLFCALGKFFDILLERGKKLTNLATQSNRECKEMQNSDAQHNLQKIYFF